MQQHDRVAPASPRVTHEHRARLRINDLLAKRSVERPDRAPRDVHRARRPLHQEPMRARLQFGEVGEHLARDALGETGQPLRVRGQRIDGEIAQVDRRREARHARPGRIAECRLVARTAALLRPQEVQQTVLKVRPVAQIQRHARRGRLAVPRKEQRLITQAGP